MSDLHPLTIEWLAYRDSIRSTRSRLGLPGYAHLCAILRDRPSTAPELMELAHLGHVAVYRVVMSMWALRLVHIVDWRARPGQKYLPVFKFGSGDDWPAPSMRPNGRTSAVQAPMPRRRVCAAVVSFAYLLRTIELPARVDEIVEEAGLSKNTVKGALGVMEILGLVHVCDWQCRPQGGGVPIPIYQLGPGARPKRPKPPKRRTAERTYRAKLKHLHMIHATAGAVASNTELEAA